eukprot:357392-Chlamydomonas_euryale.AAC.37
MAIGMSCITGVLTLHGHPQSLSAAQMQQLYARCAQRFASARTIYPWVCRLAAGLPASSALAALAAPTT